MSSWARIPLGEVAEIVKGGVDPQRASQTIFAHYSIPAFDDGISPVIEMGESIKSQKTLIPSPIVLVSKLNPRIPRVWHVDDEQSYQRICSTEFVPIAAKTDQIDTQFLAYALRYSLSTGEITGSTSAATKSRERAKPADFLRLIVPLPPLTEQRRIVDVLSRAEGIMRLRRDAEKKAAELIPALFLDMFGDPRTNPKGWPVTTIGEVIESAEYGSSTKASSDGAGQPLIRMGNVDYAGNLDLTDLKHVELSDEEIKKYRLEAGDILFNRTNSKELVGKTGLWDGSCEAIAASYFIRVRVKRENLNPFYLWALMNSAHMKRVLFDTARGAIGQANINARELRGFGLPVPPLAAQDKFERQCRDIAGLKDQQSIATGKAKSTFDALLARTFCN